MTGGTAAPKPPVAENHLWHPFSDMSLVRGNEVVIERGEGVWLWTDTGERLLDACASLWYANLGHGRTEIAAAVAEQMGRLEAYSIFGELTTPPARELADRLAALAPMEDARVFLTTGGGEAIDTAAKIVRRHWDLIAQPRRQHLIGRIGGYHGTNGFGTSIGGIEGNRVGFGALIPHVSYVEYDSIAALEQEIARVGAENVAAFFMEPVMGAGGVMLPPDGYVEAVAELCDATGILLVADSVICGFGRLGTWFGIERWGVQPDLITFAKGVTGGYLPVGGVIASWRVAEPFWSRPGAQLRHGATYSGHAACAAAALCALDIYEREELIGRGAELERPLADALAGLAGDPLVAEVRAGIGLMAAVELASPELVPDVYAALRRQGVLGRVQSTGIAVSPPLTIEESELELIGDGFAAALAEVASVV